MSSTNGDEPSTTDLCLTIDQEIEGWPRGLEQQPAPNVVAEARARLAWLVCNAVLEAYRSGEVDFLHAMNVANRVAAGSGREFRLALLGETTIRALEMGKPKQLGRWRNRSRPQYPEWLKNLAVDLVQSIRDGTPYFPARTAQAARTEVAALLVRVRLCPSPLSERTLRDWGLERQHALGTSAKRGRPRKQ